MTVSKGVTVLTKGDTPKKLHHRTAAAILQGILATGLIPGSNSSGRARNYLSAVGVDDAQYKSGTCSNQPIETALDTLQAAEDLEATREGEPQFRAKREYEEVASSSSGPAMPKAQTAKAKPVVTKAMPKAKPTSFIDKAINVAVTEDVPPATVLQMMVEAPPRRRTGPTTHSGHTRVIRARLLSPRV
eukprot:s2852_g7.t1